MKFAPIAKSLLAGLIAAISFAVPVVDDGLVPSEILGIALAGALGLGVVYRVPNREGGINLRNLDNRGAASIAELAFAAFLVACALVVLVRYLG